MFEPKFVEEECVPLIDQHENNDESVYEDSQAETSFSQEDEQQQQELDVDINALERDFNVKYHPKNEFALDVLAVISKSKNLQENTSASQNPTANFWQKVPCAAV